MDELKAYCKQMNLSFKQRRQGSRYYVTIGTKIDKASNTAFDWVPYYYSVVERYFPQAKMTSGSASGATFMVGDVMEMLKK